MLKRWTVLLTFAAVLVLTGCARDTRAEEAAGVVYTGTHDAGGIIELTLSSAGDSITSMVVAGIAGGSCTWDTIDLSNWAVSIPVTDGHFDAVNDDGDRFSGQFGPNGQAEGTIQVHDPDKGCETPPLRWVASTEG